MSSKFNLFDFIDQTESDFNKELEAGNIVFFDKRVESLEIPTMFQISDKSIKILKDIKYFNIKDFKQLITRTNYKLFNDYILICAKGFEEVSDKLESIIKNHVNYDILKSRVKEISLEKIGQSLNISRERVRQIESQTISELYIFIELFIYFAYINKKFIDRLFIDLSELFTNIKDKEVIQIIFYITKKNNNKYIIYNKDFGAFYNVDKKELLTKISKLITLEDLFNYYEHYSKINNDVVYKLNVIDFTFDIYKSYLLNNKYTIKGNIAFKNNYLTPNRLLSLYIKENYKKGVVLDKTGLKKLNEEINENYNYNFKIMSAYVKVDDANKELILWGKQKRIHIDNVNVTKEKTKEIIETFTNMFEDKNYMILSDIFDQMSDILENTEIKNKYQLYGFLKYYLQDKYYFKKMGVRKLHLKNHRIFDLVHDYIASNDMTTLDNIVNDLDVTQSGAAQVIRENTNIIEINGHYTLLDKLTLPKDVITEIGSILKEAVGDYIHKDSIFDRYKEYLISKNITDENMFYRICKYYYQDDYVYYLPYIQSKKYPKPVTCKKIILEYFDKNNGIIDIHKAIADLGKIVMIKEFSLFYYLNLNNIEVFRMAYDRICLKSSVRIDDINKYQIKNRIKTFLSTKPYGLETDLENLSKGLFYYVNDQKCYMNSYSLCSCVTLLNDKNIKVISSQSINNFIQVKYAITKEYTDYIKLIYDIMKESINATEISKIELHKLIKEKRLLTIIPSDLLKDYCTYENEKVIFRK